MAKSTHTSGPGDSDTDLGDADDASDDLNADELDVDNDDMEAGKTNTRSGPTDDPLADLDLSGPRRPGELDTDDMLAAAPVFEEPFDDAAAPVTGLTAVGLPSFADPPDATTSDEAGASDEADPSDDDASADDKGSAGAADASDRGAAVPPFPVPSSQETADDVSFEQVVIPGVGTPPAGDSIPEIDVSRSVSASTKNSKGTRSDKTDSQRAVSHRPRAARSSDAASQRMLLILLASYASAITLACVWLWWNRNAASPHALENLPDVAPLDPNEFRFVPQGATMPPGHTLPLGGSEQLGYIRVEPLRVTRGPVEFTHYDDAAQTREPTDPVLKLWVRFTNMSDDQLIAPLDAALLFTRSYQPDTDTILANQLVQSADKQSAPTYVLDHPLSSDWDLKGQSLGYRLKPGESLETYIPTDPAGQPLTGDLVWRVHFRKGYNPQTGHGVTTMIEVPFAASQVESDPS